MMTRVACPGRGGVTRVALIATCVLAALPTALSAQVNEPVALASRAPVDSARTSRERPREMRSGSNAGRDILFGALIGGVVGYVASTSMCKPGSCDDSAPVLVPTVLFALGGGIVGGIVGSLTGPSRSPGNTKLAPQSPSK